MSDNKGITRRNEKVGEVVSTKMAKTIVVEVTRRVSHPLYRRVMKRRKRFYAHDEDGVARLGDTVRIMESRPLSRLKKWRLVEVLRRAAQISAEAERLENLAVEGAGEKVKA